MSFLTAWGCRMIVVRSLSACLAEVICAECRMCGSDRCEQGASFPFGRVAPCWHVLLPHMQRCAVDRAEAQVLRKVSLQNAAGVAVTRANK